jgi:hypothetical protein
MNTPYIDKIKEIVLGNKYTMIKGTENQSTVGVYWSRFKINNTGVIINGIYHSKI